MRETRPKYVMQSNSDRAKRLHHSPWRGAFHLTGGAGFLSEMLGEAGASRTVLEAKVPYAAASLAELLGGQPEQACSGATARAMAMVALQRALQLAHSAEPAAVGGADALPADANAAPAADQLFGFAATASLATDHAKRGPCRAHIAVQTLAQTHHAALALAGERPAQEAALVEHCWRTLLQALELETPGKPTTAAADAESRAPNQPQAGLPADEAGRIERVLAPKPWRSLISGTSNAILMDPRRGAFSSQPGNGDIAGAGAPPLDRCGKLLFPGAFNPLHEGHRRMMAVAEAKTKLAGAFELSVQNIDKLLLDYVAIQRRLAQFEHPVWLTRLSSFVEKAKRFPGATFIVGVDTLVRIADPRYYGGEAGLHRALAALADRKARFLVFGRTLNAAFQGLAEVELPPALRQMCLAVSEAEFRADISSTALRQQGD